MSLESFTVADLGTVKLGRITPAVPRLAPLFGSYVTAGLENPPETLDLGSRELVWPMYANNRYGDCVFVTCAHHLGLWTAHGSPPQKTFTDEAVLQMYSEVTGFDPRNPRTDRGAVIADALAYLCRPGKGLDGSTTAAFMRVNPAGGFIRVRQAAWLFGGLHLGIALPAAWQNATGPGKIWDTGRGRGYQPGSWGGHAVCMMTYDAEGVTVATWGRLQRMTWRAFSEYVDEAYCLVDWQWAQGTKPLPHGFDLQRLMADWQAMGGDPLTPPVPPPPVPPPTPIPNQAFIGIDLTGRVVRLPPGWTTTTV